jgi:hypothetical protein
MKNPEKKKKKASKKLLNGQIPAQQTNILNRDIANSPLGDGNTVRVQ